MSPLTPTMSRLSRFFFTRNGLQKARSFTKMAPGELITIISKYMLIAVSSFWSLFSQCIVHFRNILAMSELLHELGPCLMTQQEFLGARGI